MKQKIYFEVDRAWLRACGKPVNSPVFRVIDIQPRAVDGAPGYVTIDCYGFPWVVDERRGKYLAQPAA